MRELVLLVHVNIACGSACMQYGTCTRSVCVWGGGGSVFFSNRVKSFLQGWCLPHDTPQLGRFSFQLGPSSDQSVTVLGF